MGALPGDGNVWKKNISKKMSKHFRTKQQQWSANIAKCNKIIEIASDS